jgi:peptidyl-prolyl cis-trans isomerase C
MTCVVHDTLGLPKPAAVSVNGVAIPRDAIARETQNHPAAKPPLAWHAAARALVIRELLLQEARRLAIEATPMHDDAGRRETEEEALIRELIDREVVTPQPDEETCRRYYSQNRARFRSPAIFEVAHILFAADGRVPKVFAAAARAAESVLAELRSEPRRFAELARMHSACPSAAQGGNLGQVSAGQTTPEFEEALHALSPGELTPTPVATRYGLHIIRIDRKIDGRELPFEAVATEIADYLHQSVRRRASAQFIARLVSQAQISGILLEGAAAHRVSEHRVN